MESDARNTYAHDCAIKKKGRYAVFTRAHEVCKQDAQYDCRKLSSISFLLFFNHIFLRESFLFSFLYRQLSQKRERENGSFFTTHQDQTDIVNTSLMVLATKHNHTAE